MKTEFTYDEVFAYFENMAIESMAKHGRQHPSAETINSFIVGAMCSTIACLVSGGAEDMANFRRRLQ